MWRVEWFLSDLSVVRRPSQDGSEGGGGRAPGGGKAKCMRDGGQMITFMAQG